MKTDRINRAHAIITCALITPLGPGRWHVQSDSQNVGYIVTGDGCNCYDWQNRNALGPCKHFLAVFAPAAVEAIIAMRGAATVDELYEVWADQFRARDWAAFDLEYATALQEGWV